MRKREAGKSYEARCRAFRLARSTKSWQGRPETSPSLLLLQGRGDLEFSVILHLNDIEQSQSFNVVCSIAKELGMIQDMDDWRAWIGEVIAISNSIHHVNIRPGHGIRKRDFWSGCFILPRTTHWVYDYLASGRDVALASKEGLHIIDLDSPYSPPRYLAHRTSWEVADVQWSPFAVRDYWVVSTSNQKALVWNLGAKSWQDSIELVLHGHSRSITDINFSAHNPDILATCAVDSFVHCWDLRAPLRPAFSFSDWFAAATQVKWSRQDEHVIASSHDKFLHIWDDRKGAVPVRTIEAHHTKICGIDWNRFHPHKLATCSLDRTIKFWDTTDEKDVPERVIETPFPLSRARHTPFGWGLVAMPQRGSGDLDLYDRRPIDNVMANGQIKPVAKFAGHTGQVKEFLWRSRGTVSADSVDNRDFQLISWGTDRELRLHRIDPDAMESIGYEKGISKSQRLNLTRRGARYRTFRDIPEDSASPIDPPSRGESLPSQHQVLAFRKRNSTTVGMSKVPMSSIRGWVSGVRRSSRVAMHGKSNANGDINPIAWLKNVKIASWDPDALAEEIRHVGEKFKRVDFETVDVKHRKVVMSLQAPWSEHQNAIYLRVDIRFPQLYPRGANAVITVQKTGAIVDDLHRTLSAELQTISEAYAAQKRGCMEAILRYLLREQSLEQIVAWVSSETLADSKILVPGVAAADDSSDSDDDQLDGLGDVLAAPANVRVPLAKGCGAIWSETGVLVCFFPPKPKEPNSVLATLNVQDLEKSETAKLFEGFGRLHTGSPARRAPNGTKTTDDESDSDSTDSLLSSASSSSSSSEPVADIKGGYLPYHKNALAFPNRTRSYDWSNRSTTMAGVKNADVQRHTIVSIKTFDTLIPSRKDLAVRYKLTGDGAEVCSHNAAIADEMGRTDLHSAWLLAAMVLSQTVPLQTVAQAVDGVEKNFMVIARKITSKLKKKDSGIGLLDKGEMGLSYGQVKWGNSPLASSYLIPAMFDYFERIADVQMLAMLSYIFANNPSARKSDIAAAARGGRSLVSSDSYYPSVAVAESMLRPATEPIDYVWVPPDQQPHMARLLSSLDEHALLRSRRGTAVSLDPAMASYRNDADGRLLSRAHRNAADEYERALRSTAVSLSTSPEGVKVVQRASTSSGLSTAQASLSALTQSYSHSPPGQPGSTGVASSLKKYSPSGSLTPGWGIFSSGHGQRSSRASVHYVEPSSHDKDTSLRSTPSMSNLRYLRRDGRSTPDAGRRSVRSFAPSEASDTTRRPDLKGKKKVFKTRTRNQNAFDLDSYVNLPLLDPALHSKYQGFRTSYAQLLESWELPLQRAEILKTDGGFSEALSFMSSPRKRSRRKTMTGEADAEKQGLQIRRCCQNCGDILAAIEKNGVTIGWNCVNALCGMGHRKISKRSYCSICWKAVRGRAVPCLQCEHLTCWDCAREWFGTGYGTNTRPRGESATSTMTSVGNVHFSAAVVSAQAITEDEEVGTSEPRTCPTGCGCPCPTFDPSSITVPGGAPSDGTSNPGPGQLPYLPPPQMVRSESQTSTMSKNTTITATTLTDASPLNAFFALTRSRSASKSSLRAKGKGRVMTGPVVTTSNAGNLPADDQPQQGGHRREISDRVLEEKSEDSEQQKETEKILNPWSAATFASLGRGVGGGLSRGLKEKGSDSTIRGG